MARNFVGTFWLSAIFMLFGSLSPTRLPAATQVFGAPPLAVRAFADETLELTFTLPGKSGFAASGRYTLWARAGSLLAPLQKGDAVVTTSAGEESRIALQLSIPGTKSRQEYLVQVTINREEAATQVHVIEARVIAEARRFPRLVAALATHGIELRSAGEAPVLTGIVPERREGDRSAAPVGVVLWTEAPTAGTDLATIDSQTLDVNFSGTDDAPLALLESCGVGWRLTCPAGWLKSLCDDPQIDAAVCAALEAALHRQFPDLSPDSNLL